jgi:uncharacterized membrane protein
MDILTPVPSWGPLLAIAIGIVTFFAMIGLALGGGRKLGQLDEGEVRKAITIAFTTIYLTMLPCYFFYAYMPAAQNATFVSNQGREVQGTIQTFNATATAVPLLAIADFVKNFLYLYIIIILSYFVTRAVEDFHRSKNPTLNALKKYTSGVIDNDRLDKIYSMVTERSFLAERYAKGELTREQFLQIKEDLKDLKKEQ